MCIAIHLDAAKRRVGESSIESTAHVRYANDVLLTPEQKRVLVAYVVNKSHTWFKSPERFTPHSIRLNEIVVSNAQHHLQGWVVNWKFQFIKRREITMLISRSDLDFAIKRQEKK